MSFHVDVYRGNALTVIGDIPTLERAMEVAAENLEEGYDGTIDSLQIVDTRDLRNVCLQTEWHRDRGWVLRVLNGKFMDTIAPL